jgi:hypothetical protein
MIILNEVQKSTSSKENDKNSILTWKRWTKVQVTHIDFGTKFGLPWVFRAKFGLYTSIAKHGHISYLYIIIKYEVFSWFGPLVTVVRPVFSLVSSIRLCFVCSPCVVHLMSNTEPPEKGSKFRSSTGQVASFIINKARLTGWNLRKSATGGCASSRLVQLIFPSMILGLWTNYVFPGQPVRDTP